MTTTTDTTTYVLRRYEEAIISPAPGAIPLHPGRIDGFDASTEWMVPTEQASHADDHLAHLRGKCTAELAEATDQYLRGLLDLARQARRDADYIRNGTNIPTGLAHSSLLGIARYEERYQRAIAVARSVYVPTETITATIRDTAAGIDSEGRYR